MEPLSGVPGYPLRTAADVIAVLDRVGMPTVRMLADLYHLTVNGDDLARVIEAYTERIGHVQIADAPGRALPERGIDFHGHLTHLAARGYRGHVSLEYRADGPRPFGWLPPARRGGSPWGQR